MTKKMKQAASHERERQKRLAAQKNRAQETKKTVETPKPSMSIEDTLKKLERLKGQSFKPHGDPKLFSKIDTAIPEKLQKDYGTAVVADAVAAIVFAVDRFEKVSDDLEDFTNTVESGGYGAFNLIYTTAIQVPKEAEVRGIILGSSIILTSLDGRRNIINPRQIYTDNKQSSKYAEHIANLLDVFPPSALDENEPFRLLNDDARLYGENRWVKV